MCCRGLTRAGRDVVPDRISRVSGTAADDVPWLCSEWDTCSDMLPINMIIPIIFYSCWLVPLTITTYIPREQECYTKPGHAAYRVGEIMIYSAFCAQLFCELMSALLALRGEPVLPFSTSKNHCIDHHSWSQKGRIMHAFGRLKGKSYMLR